MQTVTSLSTYLSVDFSAASMSWLLWTALQGTLVCVHNFEWSFCLGIHPGVRLQAHMIPFFLGFFGNLHTVFHGGCIWWWCCSCLEKWCWTSSVQMNISSWSSHCFRPLTYSIVWREEPGGLKSMGSQRVRLDWEADTHTYSSDVHAT